METLSQSIQEINWTLVSCSLFPVILLIILMGLFKLSGDKSAVATLISAIVIGFFAFNYPFKDVGLSILYGSIKAILQIILIIIMAIFSYNILLHTKKIELIKEQLSSVSTDKGIQVLLLTWGFGGLLEGMAGFGTAVAIPAAIMISLGYKPIFSAVTSLVANTVPTAFGAVGIPVKVLSDQTGLSDQIQTISSNLIIQLSPLMFIIPLILVLMTDSKMKSLPKHLFLCLLVGLGSLVSQYLSAKYMGAETPAIIGSIISILIIIAFAKLTSNQKDKELSKKYPTHSIIETFKAWSVYLIILALIILTSPLFPSIKGVLEKGLVTKIQFNIFDFSKSASVEKEIKVAWLLNAGVLIFIGSVIGGLIQGASLMDLLKLLKSVIIKQSKTIITICALISLSSIMDFSGMINQIGIALTVTTGALYPLFSPLIGGLGTFISGSDTSSNILFGKLQTTVGNNLNIDATWMAASNTAGATAGKMISPQSIAIATSSCSMQGEEGNIMKRTLPYALIYIAIAGALVYFIPQFFS